MRIDEIKIPTQAAYERFSSAWKGPRGWAGRKQHGSNAWRALRARLVDNAWMREHRQAAEAFASAFSWERDTMWLAKKLENGSSVVFLREAVCIGDVAWRAPFGRLEDLYVNHFIIGSAFAATDWVYEAFRSLPLAQQQELWRDTVQVATPQGPVDVPLADLNSVQARQVISWLDEYRSNTPNPCLRNLEEQLEWLRGQYRLSKGWVAYFQARQGAAVARLRQGQPAEADPADLIEAALPDPPAAAINARRDARRRARQSRSKKL